MKIEVFWDMPSCWLETS